MDIFTQEPVRVVQEWPAIIAALFVGIGTVITALVAGCVLILQVVHKNDEDRKLAAISVSVDGNFSRLQDELKTALELLEAIRPPITTAAQRTAEHRRLHHRET